MRIKIEIEDTLIADAMVASGLKSGHAAVEKVLRDYVAQHNMKKAWEELRGMGWHGDLDKMRRGEISPLDEHQDAAE